MAVRGKSEVRNQEKTGDGKRQKTEVRGQGKTDPQITQITQIKGKRKDRDQKTEISGQGKRLPVAKELGETSLMFKVHPTLTKENMHYVVEQVMGVLNFKC